MNHSISRLRVVATWDGRNEAQCRAICVCGTVKDYRLSNVTHGLTISCGCARKKHDQSFTRTYRSWAAMIQRCSNPNSHGFEYYGGRGISVCGHWKKYTSFLADMGDRPEGTSLDRFPDPDGNYEPGNCRWATRSEQRRNRTRRKPESSSAKAEEELDGKRNHIS